MDNLAPGKVAKIRQFLEGISGREKLHKQLGAKIYVKQSVAYIIESRGFRSYILENPTKSIIFACTAECCVLPVERTHVFLGVCLLGVSKYCFYLRPPSIASWVSC